MQIMSWVHCRNIWNFQNYCSHPCLNYQKVRGEERWGKGKGVCRVQSGTLMNGLGEMLAVRIKQLAKDSFFHQGSFFCSSAGPQREVTAQVAPF